MRGDYNSVQCVPRFQSLGCACENCQSPGLSGLGDSSAAEYTQPIGMVANVILPGSGQIIQMLGSILDSLFGWGDPHSIDDLFNVIVQARMQLAAVHKAMGIPDPFHLPIDYTGNEDEMADLAMFITNEYKQKVPINYDELNSSWNDLGHILGDYNGKIWNAYPSSERRDDSYAVIKWLQSELQSTQMDAENMQLTQTAPPPQILPPTQNSTYSATQTALPQNDPSQTPAPPPTQAGLTLPMVAMVGGGVLVLLAIAKGVTRV